MMKEDLVGVIIAGMTDDELYSRYEEILNNYKDYYLMLEQKHVIFPVKKEDALMFFLNEFEYRIGSKKQ